MTTKTHYEIQTLRDGNWTNDGLGDDNRFESEGDALKTIDELIELGEDWSEGQYRVVEIDSRMTERNRKE